MNEDRGPFREGQLEVRRADLLDTGRETTPTSRIDSDVVENSTLRTAGGTRVASTSPDRGSHGPRAHPQAPDALGNGASSIQLAALVGPSWDRSATTEWWLRSMTAH